MPELKLETTKGPREPRGFPLSGGELAAIVLFWVFLALLTAAGRMIDPRGPELEPIWVSALVTLSFFEYAIWAVLSVPIVWLASYLSVDDTRRLGRVALFIVAGIVIAILVDFAVAQARVHLLPMAPFRPRGFGRRPPMVGLLGRIARLEFVDDLMVYLAVLGAGVARGYFLRLQQHREESARLAAQASELQAQLAQAQLAVLRTQLDPHFLFNTLHAISALVERDPRGVRRMIARLSELLRHSLEGMREQEVSVSEELDLLTRYVEIMQVRFQGRIAIEVDADPSVDEALVPTFVLQPLVENAIEHGASKVATGGHVAVRVRRDADDVVLSVWNDGPPVSRAGASEGVGLANTRARVRALYGARYGVALREADGGTVAEVRVPFHTESTADESLAQSTSAEAEGAR